MPHKDNFLDSLSKEISYDFVDIGDMIFEICVYEFPGIGSIPIEIKSEGRISFCIEICLSVCYHRFVLTCRQSMDKNNQSFGLIDFAKYSVNIFVIAGWDTYEFFCHESVISKI